MPTVTKAANAHTTVSTGWVNPANAYATTGDNVYATATPPGKNTTANGDFGFPAFTTSDIPDGSLLDLVTITVEWGMTAAVTGATLGGFGRLNSSGRQLSVEILKTTTTEAQLTITLQGVTLNDLRTAGELLVRLRCSKGNTTNALSGNLDFCSLSVIYTAPPTTIVPVAAAKLEATGTSVSGSVSATAGNALFAGVVAYTANLSGTISAPTRSTDTFTIDTQGDTSASSLRSRIAITSAPNVAGGSSTFSVSCTNGQVVQAYILEESGLPTSSMQDATSPAIANGSGATAQSNSLATATADAMFIGLIGCEATLNPSTIRPGSNWYDAYDSTWLGEQDGASWIVSDMQFRIEAATVTRSVSATITSSNWGALIAAYKAAPTGGGSVSLTGTVTASGAAAISNISLAEVGAVAAQGGATGSITSVIALSGNAGGQAVVATALRLLIVGSGAAGASATAAVAIALAGTAGGTASATAAPLIALVGSVAAGAITSGTLSTGAAGANLTGTAAGSGGATGALTVSLIGSVVAQAVSTSAVSLRLVGAAAPQASATTALSVALVGTAGGAATSAAALRISLQGAVVAQAVVAGSLAAAGALAGQIAAGGSATGALRIALVGAVTAGASPTASMVLLHTLAASTTRGQATVVATLVQAIALTAGVTAGATVSASVHIQIAGVVAGQGSAAGALSGIVLLPSLVPPFSAAVPSAIRTGVVLASTRSAVTNTGRSTAEVP